MRKVLFLFGQLNDDDVEWMLDAGPSGSCRRATSSSAGRAGRRRLHPPGGPARGLAELRRGPEREIARLNAGEIVGEMSFVDARPPSATVQGPGGLDRLRHLQGRPQRQARRRPGLRRPLLPRPGDLPLDHGARAPPGAAATAASEDLEEDGGRCRRAGRQRAGRRLPGGGAVRPDGQAGDGGVSVKNGNYLARDGGGSRRSTEGTRSGAAARRRP